ncbi:DNA recombination protein RmuC [Wenxinia saemankumensis]|uniref:DNA recombination protein RmuC homolog n=1 Tax=Wenxinia saemankumensis TaxID=1447782 RepID=A0A1M6GZR1_9RHOB|nr:DNA recombination protein RmuC [Wenxinia saemankumensis]SHJ15457.1 DNA recombination protein RmuC [Wenxinia saemankumensis]
MPFSSEALVAALAFVALALLAIALLSVRSGRAQLAALRADLDAARTERDRAGERLDGRETRLAELSAELEALRAARETDRAAHDETARQAAALREAVTRMEAAAEKAAAEMAALQGRHGALQDEHGALQRRHAHLQADTDGKLASAEREVAALKDLREEMSRRFEELAGATLRRTGEDFSKAHTARLTELLTPFREHVGRFEAELRQVHGKADEERARLAQQISMLTTQTETVRSEAANLTRALKGDQQKQGAWGEMILERILEDSGLQEGLHYETQASRTDEEGGRYRPDVVVKMPRRKVLVVDSKVSLKAYNELVAAEDDAPRAEALARHVASLRRHIDTLAAKGYDRLEQGSVDYVLMFVPIEGALSAALGAQGDLTSYAVSKGVGVMTPTTLMVTLRTVEHIWTVERRESNAEEIARRAGLLYDKVAGFVDNMNKVGTHLDNAVRAHSDAYGQLRTGSGNVLRQVEMLKEMGARTKKSLATEFDGADEPRALPGEAAD